MKQFQNAHQMRRIAVALARIQSHRPSTVFAKVVQNVPRENPIVVISVVLRGREIRETAALHEQYTLESFANLLERVEDKCFVIALKYLMRTMRKARS